MKPTSLAALVVISLASLFACGPQQRGNGGTSQGGLSNGSAPECTYTCALDCVCQSDANGCDVPACEVLDPSFTCGDRLCGADQYCEKVVSDVPEFDGSYTRATCLPLGACAGSSDRACLSASAKCEVSWDGNVSRFAGTCAASSANHLTFTCLIGG